METKIIKGIVLNIYDYNDNDVLIKIINEKSKLTLLAKGFKKSNSKNRSNVSIGSYVEFEIFEKYGLKNKKKLLKKSKIKKFFDISLVDSNLTKKIFWILQQIEEPNYSFYFEYINFLEGLEKKEWIYSELIVTYLLKFIFESKGKKINWNVCTICLNNKNLFIFNILEGGMFCWKHKTNKGITNLNFIKSLYYLGINIDLYCNHTNFQINKKIFNFFKHHLDFEG